MGLARVSLDENGYELYHSEFVKEGKDWFLRVYVDLAAGKDAEGNDVYISTEDCEKVSRYLSEKLDEADPIEQNYYLEVSSPGMDRPLIKPEHYKRYVGEEIELKLYKATDGVKNIEGVLTDFAPSGDDYSVTVRDHNDKEWNLMLSEIAKASKAVIF
ncbi:MAG: ribosome maturation factor RimP [Firmicutes bacterium]|nr:ribosome maturation factor RimP [Bacillota bacterium]